jgi:hypothetical protein
MLMLEVDNVVLLVELEVTEVLAASDELTIIALNDVVCVCALAKNPGNDDRRARKAMAMRMYELVFLPKPATFHTCLTGTLLHHIQGYCKQTTPCS